MKCTAPSGAVEPTDSPEKAGLGIYGSIISEKSIYSGQLTVGYVTSDLFPVRLISGRLPEKPGEAAVEESLGQALMTGISVGDEAEFTIKTPEGETRTLSLTVVGFTKSTSRLSVNDGKRYLVPSIIVAEGAIDCFPDIYSVTSGESYSSDAMINPRYTDAVIVSVSESTRVLLTVTAILTVMAAAVSAFVFVSVTKPVMNRHFADLRLAGAGGRELAEFTVLRTLVLSLFAAAVGTTAGYGCLAVFTRTVLEHFLDSCTVSFPWVACLLTCIGIFAVITLPGLSAVRKAVSHRPLEAVQAKRHTAAGQSRPISPNGVSYSIFGKWTRETSKKAPRHGSLSHCGNEHSLSCGFCRLRLRDDNPGRIPGQFYRRLYRKTVRRRLLFVFQDTGAHLLRSDRRYPVRNLRRKRG